MLSDGLGRLVGPRCDKMIFEGSDASLRCVATVHAWREKLVSDIIVRVKIFHDLGRLII